MDLSDSQVQKLSPRSGCEWLLPVSVHDWSLSGVRTSSSHGELFLSPSFCLLPPEWCMPVCLIGNAYSYPKSEATELQQSRSSSSSSSEQGFTCWQHWLTSSANTQLLQKTPQQAKLPPGPGATNAEPLSSLFGASSSPLLRLPAWRKEQFLIFFDTEQSD